MAEQITDIERARDAILRRSWAEAYEEFKVVDPSRLTPQDLEGLADAAWWLSKFDESIAARQKAYSIFAKAREEPPAAGVAARLSIEHFERGEPSVGMGWLMKAQRHLGEQPECTQHGYIALIEANLAYHGGEPDEAMALAQRVIEIGQRFGNRDLIAMGIHLQGLVRISEARVQEGLALLDEAMTSVVAGELSPLITGAIFCSVLNACLDLADLGRAGEWNEAARAWCETLPENAPFTALCRINRAQVATLRGAWSEAETEARWVSEEQTIDPIAAARGFYEAGEIRRRIGNYADAEQAFARANELGLEPQPGLALLRLAQGKPESALTALRLAVDGESTSRLRRARLLAALVDVALAVGDLDSARPANDDLETIARDFETPAVEAAAVTARGALRLAEGDVSGALVSLRSAGAAWRELRLPYETARCRMLYGVALRRAGDEDAAILELRAALAAFEQLGAAPDAGKAVELLGLRSTLPRGITAREAEVLRLVASGMTNREIAAGLMISEHTVARHLQNIFSKLNVSSRSAATAFAFAHDLA